MNVQEKLAIFLATGAYTGYVPVAPGTAGSVVGVILVLFLRNVTFLWTVVFIVFLFFFGVYVSDIAESFYKRKDPGEVVIDEIVGVLVAFWGIFSLSIFPILAVFVLFRIFDIAKIPPCSQCETLKGGWGIMMDDVVAGVYANISFRIICFVYSMFVGS